MSRLHEARLISRQHPRTEGRREPSKEQNSLDVDLAKILSFMTMAQSLRKDLGMSSVDRAPRLLAQPGDRFVPAPLAKSVAKERLKKLGLSRYISLKLADIAEVPIPEESLSEAERESRRAVVAYTWKGGMPDERSSRILEKMIQQAGVAYETFANAGLDLVKRVAFRFNNKGVEFEELIGEGNEELARTALRFDWRKGIAFDAFLRLNLNGKMLKTLRDHGSSLKPSREVWDNVPQVKRAIAALEASRTKVTPESVAKETGLSEGIVQEVLYYQALIAFSLDDDRRSMDANGEYGLLVREKLGELDGGYDAVELGMIATMLMDGLPDRERRIVYYYYWGELNQYQIADKLGISQMTVSRSLKAVKDKLREDFPHLNPERQFGESLH